MPAAPAGVLFIETITDGTGAVAVQIQVNWNASTGALTGATVTNNTNSTYSAAILDATTDPPTVIRKVSIPKGTTPTVLSANQLKQAGFSTATDCQGITFAQV